MPTYPDRSSSLWLDPISSDWFLCRLVSTGHSRHPSPTLFLELLCPTLFSRSLTHFRSPEISSPKPFDWFRTKTDKGIVCLADHLHSVTLGSLLVVIGICHGFRSKPFIRSTGVLCSRSAIPSRVQVWSCVNYYSMFQLRLTRIKPAVQR